MPSRHKIWIDCNLKCRFWHTDPISQLGFDFGMVWLRIIKSVHGKQNGWRIVNAWKKMEAKALLDQAVFYFLNRLRTAVLNFSL